MPAPVVLGYGAVTAIGSYFGYNFGKPEETSAERQLSAVLKIGAVASVFALAVFYIFARYYRARRR